MSDLRAATLADLPACAGILQGWLDATPWMPKLHSLAQTQRWMEQVLFPECRMQLVTDGTVRGFLALREGGEIAQMVLAPEARGQGQGHRLMAWAEAASPAKLSLWCFEANLPARRFYEREGFSVTHGTPGDNEEGLPDLHYLRKAL